YFPQPPFVPPLPRQQQPTPKITVWPNSNEGTWFLYPSTTCNDATESDISNQIAGRAQKEAWSNEPFQIGQVSLRQYSAMAGPSVWGPWQQVAQYAGSVRYTV